MSRTQNISSGDIEGIAPVSAGRSIPQTAAPAVGVSAKDQSVETLRGIAIVLLVGYHAMDSTLGDGIQNGRSLYEYITYSCNFVRMPLFTVISGFAYAIRPVGTGRVREFLTGKSRRILLPFVTAVTATYLLRALAPGITHPLAIQDIWRAYVFSFAHFWFLQAIFLVFLVVTVLEYVGAMDRPVRWLLCLVGAAVMTLSIEGTPFLSIDGFLYLLPLFLLGVGLNRFQQVLLKRRIVIMAAIIAAGGLAIQQLVWFGHFVDVNVSKMGWLGLSVSLSGIIVLFNIRRPLPFLARLGFYSYSIYLFHGFGVALGKRLIGLFTTEDADLKFAAKLICGIALPIVAEIIFLKSAVLRRVFLGLR